MAIATIDTETMQHSEEAGTMDYPEGLRKVVQQLVDDHGLRNLRTCATDADPGLVCFRKATVDEFRKFMALKMGDDKIAEAQFLEKMAGHSVVWPDKATFGAACQELPGLSYEIGYGSIAMATNQASKLGKAR